MLKPQAKIAAKTRIQAENQDLILKSALEVFSTFGFRGATVDQIATRCGLSKPNLLYYFRRKQDIYVAVLERTLSEWLEPLRHMKEDGDPLTELRRYIILKLDMSQANPAASRLFANEILHGAPHIGQFLKGPLKKLVDEKARVIDTWVLQKRIQAVDARHLIFAIWAVTQHYADFSTQVDALLGPRPQHDQTQSAVLDILLRGLRMP